MRILLIEDEPAYRPEHAARMNWLSGLFARLWGRIRPLRGVGRLLRDSGQSRVPVPPASTTGTIFIIQPSIPHESPATFHSRREYTRMRRAATSFCTARSASGGWKACCQRRIMLQVSHPKRLAAGRFAPGQRARSREFCVAAECGMAYKISRMQA